MIAPLYKLVVIYQEECYTITVGPKISCFNVFIGINATSNFSAPCVIGIPLICLAHKMKKKTGKILLFASMYPKL